MSEIEKGNPYGETPEERKVYKKAYAKALEEMAKHTVPSPETRNFMEKISSENAVIIERLDNLRTIVENQHIENKEKHCEMIARQDHTNGNVTNLQKWRAYLVGAWTVIAFVSTVLLPFLGYYFMETMKYEIQDMTVTQIKEAKKEDITQTQIDGMIDQKITEFANKNFNSYNK